MALLGKSALTSKRKGTSPMLAEDMFEQQSIQVFDKRSGNYVGLVRPGECVDGMIVTANVDEETGLTTLQVNPAQLSIF